MSIYLNVGERKTLSDAFIGVDGEKKKVKSIYINKDGEPCKVFGNEIFVLNNRYFIFLKNDRLFYYSDDGINYETVKTVGLPSSSVDWKFAAGNGIFLLVCGASLYKSMDIQTWEYVSAVPTTTPPSNFIFIHDRFLMLYAPGQGKTTRYNGSFKYSSDGICWEDMQGLSSGEKIGSATYYDNIEYSDFIYSNGTFMCLGVANKHGTGKKLNLIYYSIDGINWKLSASSSAVTYMEELYCVNGIFIRSYSFSNSSNKTYGLYIYYSTDGINWTYKMIRSGTSSTLGLTCIAYIDEKYIIGTCLSNSNNIYYVSENLSEWTQLCTSESVYSQFICKVQDKIYFIPLGTMKNAKAYYYDEETKSMSQYTISSCDIEKYLKFIYQIHETYIFFFTDAVMCSNDCVNLHVCNIEFTNPITMNFIDYNKMFYIDAEGNMESLQE